MNAVPNKYKSKAHEARKNSVINCFLFRQRKVDIPLKKITLQTL